MNRVGIGQLIEKSCLWIECRGVAGGEIFHRFCLGIQILGFYRIYHVITGANYLVEFFGNVDGVLKSE